MMRRFALLALACMLVPALIACSSGRDDEPDDGNDRLEDGQTLGVIERLPGGTPVASDVRTFLGAECGGGRLTLRTNCEEIFGEMNCDGMLPQSVLEQYIGQPVVVRYEGGRLLVENETIGTMEMLVSDARVRETIATP